MLIPLVLAISAVPMVPRMVALPSGEYLAGSTAEETAREGLPPALAAFEQPQRVVGIGPGLTFMKTEVTRGAFARFAAATGWRPDGPCSHLADGPTNRWSADPARTWRTPGFKQDDRHPVVCVSLADATAYARWLSERTGRRFRLPTGDEWEYAARAGTRTPRWWSAGANGCLFGNLSGRERARAHNRGAFDPEKFFACTDGYLFTAPVGRFRANGWGLHDMLGNVWEWTTDCVDRTCGSVFDRGGSWTNSPRYVRAAVKHPELVNARTTVLGFRLIEETHPGERD